MFDYAIFHFKSLYEAQNKLYDMQHIANNYELLTVADYYDICSEDIHYNYTCNKYGWIKKQINAARVRHDETKGWFIELPEPLPIDHTADCASPTDKIYPKVSYREYPKSKTKSSPDTLNITVNTSELKDPDGALAGLFKMIPCIKDRVINITIV